MNDPQAQQDAFRAKCTHYRNGGMVYSVKDNSVVFDGRKDNPDKHSQGINRAKRYVSKNLYTKCFTIK